MGQQSWRVRFSEFFTQERISRNLVSIMIVTLLPVFSSSTNYSASASGTTVTSGTCSVVGTSMSTGNLIDSTTVDGTCMVRLTSGTSSFVVPTGINTVAALAVGGGGGGGFGGNGGGGGAGAVIVSDTGVTATPGSTISGTVGEGGTSGYPAYSKGGKGVDTSITINSSTFVASGGGGGSSFGTTADSGGSGGGKAINGNGPGSGFNQNYASWTERVFSGASHSGVGGGGGGGAGGSPAANSSNGAIGVSIWGYSVGGGGSGWGGGNATAAAPFGGGAPRVGELSDASGGCNNGGISCNGRANTGGGGGGGGAGGSGVIVVKFVPARGQGTIAVTNGFQTNRRSTFTFTRTGTAPSSTTASFQWQVKPAGSETWSNVTTGTGGTTASYQTGILGVLDNGSSYRISVTDSSSSYGISTTTFTEVAAQSLFTPPGGDTDTALSFSGSGMHVEVADTTGSPFDITGAVTIQAWVYPTSSCSSNQGVISKAYSYMLYCGDGGKWRFVFDSNGVAPWSGASSIFSIRENAWQHVALVKTASTTAYLYINGQLAETFTSQPTTLTPNNEPFQVGRSLTGSYFQGRIDEVRLYNVERTKAQIQSDMHTYGSVTDSNLRAYFDFNEGSGDTLYNRASGSSTSSDLTVVGSPSWPENITPSTFQAYTIRTFTRSYLTSSGGWKPPVGVSRIRALVVAGGGGGGSDEGGGGGGGGFIDTASVTVTADTATAVIVGYGGIGGEGNEVYYATNGQNSTFGTLIAIGGGAGGSSVNDDNASARNGTSGGSGGGGAGEAWAGRAGGSGTSGQGFAGGIGIVSGAGGGGGGAIEVGNTDGNSLGGDGKTSNITGVNVIYGGGGSGGNGNTSSTSFAGSDGGGGRGGSSNVTALNGTAGLGGGGGGGGSLATANSSVAFSGADGGSGVVIISWITASAPTFTAPVAVDTTTAGTRYTFRVSGSATSPLIRNYQWQFSSNSGSTWTTQQASTSDSFTTTTLETTTSGITNRYRVIVTDSDTAGLSISDSRTSYLVINPRITITVDTSTITRDYGVATVKTFTFANGTGPRVATASPGNQSGITWSNLNSDSATLTLAPTLTAGSYSDTITVTDSVTATTSLRLTITINKARQASLSIGQYNAFVGVSTYPINVYGGSGTGAVTRSRLSAGSANCTLASEMFLTATSPGICSVQAVKAGDTNYLSETATATIYWIQWSDAYATRVPSTPTEIVLNHSTAITKYNYDTLTVTSYQNSSKATVTSIGRSQTLRIVGDGFSSDSYIEVLFANMASRYIPPVGESNRFAEMQIVTESGINFLQFTVPNDAETGAITVNSPKGTAVGPSLTITP